MTDSKPIRIGFVPEHYLLPLHLAKPHFPFPVEFIPFPQGTGHMITSLKEDSIDIAIGLTEGWIAGLLKEQQKETPDYYMVGKWVKNPLRWSIVTGRNRTDINSVDDLIKHNRVGVSRMGSGSHIMSFVLAQSHGWTRGSDGNGTQQEDTLLKFVPLGALKDLIKGVTGTKEDGSDAQADFFMWEHFTTKPYFHSTTNLANDKSSELKWIGEIYTPWPSWHIAANSKTFAPSTSSSSSSSSPSGSSSSSADDHLRQNPTLNTIFQTLNRGISQFNSDPSLAVEMLGDPAKSHCHYSETDAREWLKKAEFFPETKGVDGDVVREVVHVLTGAGVLKSSDGAGSVEWNKEVGKKLGIFDF